MKKVLITGFEPFGGETVNAAWEAVRAFEEESIRGAELRVQQLPTAFGDSVRVLSDVMEQFQPDIVLCCGEAGGRSAISIERIGVNMDNARIPDNAGNEPKESPIRADGPAAYWSKLPVSALVEHLKHAGIPAEESFTAGTYVCNHVLYSLIHLLSQAEYAERGTIGGFIHVPYLPEQAVNHKNAPSLGRDEIHRGLTLVVEYLVKD